MKFTVPNTSAASTKPNVKGISKEIANPSLFDLLNLSTVRVQVGGRPVLRKRRHSLVVVPSQASSETLEIAKRRKRRAVSCPSIKRALERRGDNLDNVQSRKRFRPGKPLEQSPPPSLPKSNTLVQTRASNQNLLMKSVSIQAVFAHKFLNMVSKFETTVNKMLDKMDGSIRNVKEKTETAYAAKKSMLRIVSDKQSLPSKELCLVGRVVRSVPYEPPNSLLVRPTYYTLVK